jgi:hypothetical protein
VSIDKGRTVPACPSSEASKLLPLLPAQPLRPIGPPVIQCVVFGYAATYDLNHVPYAVLDFDGASHNTITGVSAREASRSPCGCRCYVE